MQIHSLIVIQGRESGDVVELSYFRVAWFRHIDRGQQRLTL